MSNCVSSTHEHLKRFQFGDYWLLQLVTASNSVLLQCCWLGPRHLMGPMLRRDLVLRLLPSTTTLSIQVEYLCTSLQQHQTRLPQYYSLPKSRSTAFEYGFLQSQTLHFRLSQQAPFSTLHPSTPQLAHVPPRQSDLHPQDRLLCVSSRVP